eukprot:CAMPEP_0172314698 /NCGR_PEP_ID=MMETSP1058-20130122/23173_1 /TAXON_ID=83371 /ORGANISM="Detonula confervacea, Strain CCMP 353" /LENGTH=618 /DNA_ID=CAMNT_0013028635 /DNA_START=74 /DNA_END=1930 /DNA_ORIENTATION=+
MTMSTRRRIVATTFQRTIHRYSHTEKRRHYHTTATSCSSNNNNNTNKHDTEHHHRDPLTNGGTVVGVFLFHRHGDRAPNRYLGDPDYLQNESEHWYGRIPGGDAHDKLSRYFPPEIHKSQNGGNYLDVNREPFGFLTYRGMDQMREVGSKFRQRYEKFGFVSNENTASPSARVKHGNGQYSFLDHWDVQAYSTNYLRTVMSVQCFLDGLIGKRPSDHDIITKKSVTNNSQNQIYAGGGLKRYYKDMGKHERLAHLHGSMWTTAEDMNRNGDGSSSAEDDCQIKVQVRDKEIDTLNAFDRHPQMMNGLVKDVVATEQFQRIDGNAKPLADELSTYLPGLRGAPQAFGGTPSGVNWVHANDHFVCRRSHSIPLAADFSDHDEISSENEDAEAALASMAIPVYSHLAWRFREWYRCPKLLSAVARPPFKEMMKNMVEAANDLRPNDRRPFVLYSCHDVTLLALLYAIGADFLVSGEDCGGVDMQEEGDGDQTYSGMTAGSVRKGTQQTGFRWWPAYSSTIAFELVRLDESQSLGMDEQHVIRVILNGDTLTLMPRMSTEDEGILKEQSLCSRQVFGESQMMRLSDFEQVIRVLEEAGGQGSSSSVEEDNLELLGKIGVDGG